MEHCKNGSAPHRTSHCTVMKHDESETKILSDLNAIKAAKVMSYENSIIQRISATN